MEFILNEIARTAGLTSEHDVVARLFAIMGFKQESVNVFFSEYGKNEVRLTLDKSRISDSDKLTRSAINKAIHLEVCKNDPVLGLPDTVFSYRIEKGHFETFFYAWAEIKALASMADGLIEMPDSILDGKRDMKTKLLDRDMTPSAIPFAWPIIMGMGDSVPSLSYLTESQSRGSAANLLKPLGFKASIGNHPGSRIWLYEGKMEGASRLSLQNEFNAGTSELEMIFAVFFFSDDHHLDGWIDPEFATVKEYAKCHKALMDGAKILLWPATYEDMVASIEAAPEYMQSIIANAGDMPESDSIELSDWITTALIQVGNSGSLIEIAEQNKLSSLL